MRRAVLAITLIACKSESAPPATGSGSAPAKQAAPSADLKAMIPKVDSAKVLAKKSPNDAYALETWCIDEADAIARVTSALERDGWTNVRVRGDAPKQAIAAMKGDIRFSGRTGGADSRCAGTYITATVMRLGNLDEKLLEGANKIR